MRRERLFCPGWPRATLAAALVVTASDALLLERSKGYFTGGFLSVDRLDGPGLVALFLVASVIVDAAVIGVIAAVVAWGIASIGLHTRAALTAGVLTGTVGLLIADVIAYEILRYLGDSFDLALMFDLTGGSAGELLAVASGHLTGPILLAMVASTVTGGIVWLVNRRESSTTGTRPRATMLAAPLVLAGAALIALIVAAVSSDALENGLLRKPAGQLLAFAANRITDVDRDGVGVVGRMPDPDPFDASVFPFALDVPGNGIDENGVGGDLPPGAARFPEPRVAQTRWQRRPDVILVVLESFRADLVGARLNGRAVTPFLDRLAAKGLSLRAAYSHNGYTVQSRFHLLSGTLSGSDKDGTLIDDFQANGYLVGYFSAQDESFGGLGYDVGFRRADVAYDARADRSRRYTPSTTPGSLAVPYSVVLERVGEFLRTRGSTDAPLFLYVNFHDTHFPYLHDGIETLVSPVRLERSRIAPGERDALWATYANTAANVDRAVGELLDTVTSVRSREPAVIVTADHGESLFDEGFLGHGYGLNEVQTRVPFIAANLPLTLAEPFGQIDLRSALHAALSRSPDAPASPAAHAVPDRAVFQYLGDLSRPRQIALLEAEGRLIYDFRSGRVQFGGVSVGPADLSPPARDRFLRLVRQWEWMNLARRSRAARVHESHSTS